MAARDLVALETQHVYDVYDQIATHFSDITHRAWPRVRQFIKDLPPGSLVADVGCGNGRYLRINKRVLKLGSDRCQGLVDIAGQRGHEVMAADNLHLPYRDGIFDAVISVAVIHHFASWERRVSGLRELARITRPGGRLLICVWAFEQKHRRFDGQDVLVPWTKPVKTFRQRGGSKTSLGTSSEFSSTSSISEDEVNQEQKAVAPDRGNSTDLDKGTDRPVPSTKSVHCIENGEGTVLSTISGRDVCLENLSDEDADFECLPATLKSHQTKAIRPTSLCLKYRHTAHNAYSAYKAHMANKARSLLSPGQRQSASGYQGQQRGRRVQSSSGNCTCSSVRGLTSQARLTAVKQSSSVQKASRRSGESALPSSQHLCVTQQFSRKKEASPVLTDVSQPESLGQPETSQRSVLLKLKSLLSRRSSHESDHGVARNRGLAKLGWWDHYKKCVMELERDLSSFRAFCSFVKADKDYSVLSGEFIVREFPMSSKPRDFTMSCKPRADVNPVPRPSAGEIETSSSRSNPTDTNHLPLYPNQLPSVKNGLPMDTNHLSSVEYMPADTIELPSEENSSHVDTVELPSEESVQRSCGEVETAERSVSQCRRSHGCLLNKTHCGCVSYEVEGKNPTHSSDLSRAKPVKSQPSRNEVVKHSDVSSSHAKEKAAPQDTLSCPKRQGGPSPCVTNNVETNGDNVFEDFASSMSACLSNLSGRDLTVEAAGKAVSCQRYYHVFKEGELEDLIRTYVPELRIVQSYFDHANWCLIAEKI